MKALIKSVVTTRAAVCAVLVGASSIGVAPAIHNDAFAQDYGCIGNFADTWMIHTARPQASGLQIKANDALNVYCDTNKARYAVELYSATKGGDAERKAICPGNAHVTISNSNTPVLMCTFWDGSANVVKSLTIELMKTPLPNDERSIRWSLTPEGGISGRPESGADADSGGSTVRT